MERLQREVAKQVEMETAFRAAAATEASSDKRKVMAQRERYQRSMQALLENALLNDYERRVTEIFTLFHSRDIARAVARVPQLLDDRSSSLAETYGERFRYAIAAVFGDLLQRATIKALERLKVMADDTSLPATPPLIQTICHDQLLLAETEAPADLGHISEHLRLRFQQDGSRVAALLEQATEKMRAIATENLQLSVALRLASGTQVDFDHPNAFFQPKVLTTLEATGLTPVLGLSPDQVRLLRALGLRLKSLELLCALRNSVHTVENRGPATVLSDTTPEFAIASSTRPFDFTRPGVLDTAVRRFGLVYDLSNFTAILEEVRKKGPKAEEKALQFMYIFQSRLDEIRRRRRLNFEKFLGDGAFYSARRAGRVLAAACEIQVLYDELRQSGFPFDRGMRVAINYGTYRLLPMLAQGRGTIHHHEFFGHGIVELARLTTGKSTREVQAIAEFLIHQGYDPDKVDSFLEPLLRARGGGTHDARRPFAAELDECGELVNEGIVLTLPFLDQLDNQLEDTPLEKVEAFGHTWLTFPLDPAQSEGLHAGLRYLGVARLKGMPPVELVEVFVWRHEPADSSPVTRHAHQRLIDLLRRFAHGTGDEEEPSPESKIPPQLLVVTFFDKRDQRRWVFGEYRESDDILLHAIGVPIKPPDLERGEPVEMWLIRNRHELATLYDGLRRDTTGQSLPLDSLRQLGGYISCFLAAPHRSA
jgi:hypothetical protein